MSDETQFPTLDASRVSGPQTDIPVPHGLVHPNIAAIYEAGQAEDGQHFFTMELVSGQPLDEYVREHMGGELFRSGRHGETLEILARVGAMRRRAFGDDSEPVARDPSNQVRDPSLRSG